MKNDVIYFNGCSFTYGIGVSLFESECIRFRFSHTLSEKLNYLELNNAIPGSCNQRIARRSVVDILKDKPKLAIVVWSDPARFEFVDRGHGAYKFKEDLEQVRPTSMYNYPRHKTDGFIDYYKHVASPYRDLVYTLQNMLSVKTAADLVGTKCIQMQFRPEFYHDIDKMHKVKNPKFQETIEDYIKILSEDKLILGLDSDISFFTLTNCHLDKTRLSNIPDQLGHPNKESHDIYSEWLYNFMNDNELL